MSATCVPGALGKFAVLRQRDRAPRAVWGSHTARPRHHWAQLMANCGAAQPGGAGSQTRLTLAHTRGEAMRTPLVRSHRGRGNGNALGAFALRAQTWKRPRRVRAEGVIGTNSESADKPGSVGPLRNRDSHSSGPAVTRRLKQPTRGQREQRYSPPIWSCSGWGFPCRPCCHERGALLPHLFTLACEDTSCEAPTIGGSFSVALSVASRRPAVSRHPALWSPDFPLHPKAQRLSG